MTKSNSSDHSVQNEPASPQPVRIPGHTLVYTDVMPSAKSEEARKKLEHLASIYSH